MVQRGRPISAEFLLGRMKATDVAKDRTLIVLRNLGGLLPVVEACRRMSVSETLFRRHRKAVLEAALTVLEPRHRGRPVREIPKGERRIRQLQEKIRKLEEDLTFARVREELALLVPRTARAQKKRRARRTSRSGGTPSGPPHGSRAVATPGPSSPTGSV